MIYNKGRKEGGMNKREKIQVIREAQELLARAESLLEELNDPYIEAYVIGHINASGMWAGEGLYQTLDKVIRELEAEELE